MNNKDKRIAPAGPAKIETGASDHEAAFDVPKAHGNSITGKSRAEELFARIGTGKHRAIGVSNRNNNSCVARELRALVQEARRSGDVIINEGDGAGFYRCDPNSEADVAAADHMIASLAHRAYEILEIAQAMDEALHGRYPSRGGAIDG